MSFATGQASRYIVTNPTTGGRIYDGLIFLQNFFLIVRHVRDLSSTLSLEHAGVMVLAVKQQWSLQLNRDDILHGE